MIVLKKKKRSPITPVQRNNPYKKCISDPSNSVLIETTGVKDNLSYEVIRVMILNCQVCKLRTKEVTIV